TGVQTCALPILAYSKRSISRYILVFNVSSVIDCKRWFNLRIVSSASSILVSVKRRQRFPNKDVNDLYQSSSDSYKSFRMPGLNVDSTIFISANVLTPVDILVLLIFNASRISSSVMASSEKYRTPYSRPTDEVIPYKFIFLAMA